MSEHPPEKKRRKRALRPESGPITREAPPPGWWIRTRLGTYAELRLVNDCRARDGSKLYRLLYLANQGVEGSHEWTVAALEAQKVKWLERRPSERVLADSV